MTETKEKINSNLKKESDFIPPDGGWGWMIILAAGISNLSMLPVLQQFGLLFRDKFANLGITSSETTTIINMNSALFSCVGLANGPLFKIFTYRQVSLTGAIIGFVGVMLATFSYNFATYLVSFSILYGAGLGISSSANALALNTYWKNRRRLATGLSWTATGLGPVIWPHVITALFSLYGETGAILIISGVSLHALVCGLLLQPVEWHAKKPNSHDDEDQEKLLKHIDSKVTISKQENGYFSQLSKFKNLSVFSSQYLFNEDDPENPGYEITDPGIPMMLRSNDGYFSQSIQSKSKVPSREDSTRNSQLNSRLQSKKSSMTNLLENRSRKSSTLYLNESKKNSAANLGALVLERDALKPKRKASTTLEMKIPESEIEDCPTLKAPQDLKADEKAVIEKIDTAEPNFITDRNEKNIIVSNFEIGKGNENYVYNKYQENEDKEYLKNTHSNQSYRNRYRLKSNNFNYENEVLKQASKKLEQYLQENEDNTNKIKLLTSYVDDNDNEKDIVNPNKNEEEEDIKLTFCQKVAMFFDLDLLRDYTFVNLMLGVTLANFNETNFSILTPFILGDFGKSKAEVALFMSLLGGVDLSVRFCVPFVAGKIGWDNNSFYLLGVFVMSLGRIVLAHCQSYYAVLLVAVIIGFGKGLRTVFVALVLPTYVPLHKLPGATGIQLLTAGIVFLSLGPVVGWIKGNSSPIVTLYCLNIFTWLTALSWTLEKYITSRQQKVYEQEQVKA
ncbi:unnamed protein product [Arctia plantaginis]|uniref:Major facilitator superfamily (MFS) profile domain-containing protein n=1 Tax=Arctia plantaginis TaxID=874455 RepID=A0A8S0ZNQ6_ARCPL|nr:unnamed protein product [Arctia plantaginis]